jgi:hypothetical protein
MKNLQHLLSLLLMGIAPMCLAQTNSPFLITIAANKSPIVAGGPVDLKITMKNTSDSDVDCTVWAVNAVDKSYVYHVWDENNEPLKEITRKTPSTSWPCVLKPEMTASSSSRISTLFDFSHPGTYTVQAERFLTGDPGSASIKSNTITITVLPKSEPAPQ